MNIDKHLMKSEQTYWNLMPKPLMAFDEIWWNLMWQFANWRNLIKVKGTRPELMDNLKRLIIALTRRSAPQSSATSTWSSMVSLQHRRWPRILRVIAWDSSPRPIYNGAACKQSLSHFWFHAFMFAFVFLRGCISSTTRSCLNCRADLDWTRMCTAAGETRQGYTDSASGTAF